MGGHRGMDFFFVVWWFLLALILIVWVNLLRSFVRVTAVTDESFTVSGRFSRARTFRWNQVSGTARKFSSFPNNAGMPRIDVGITTRGFFSFPVGLSVRIENTPEFHRFEDRLRQAIPVEIVENLGNLFRRG